MKIINLRKGFKLHIPNRSLSCEHSFKSDSYGMPQDCECGMPYKVLCLIPEKKARGRKRLKDIHEPCHGVEDIEGFFNAGLGVVTYGTRDAEKKGKALGLVCTGGEKLKMIKPKDELTPIIEDGLRKMAWQRNRE